MEPLERVVHAEHGGPVLDDEVRRLVEADLFRAGTPLGGELRADAIDEDPPHRHRSARQELSARRESVRGSQPRVRLVQESRRGERLAAGQTQPLATGNRLQLLIQ